MDKTTESDPGGSPWNSMHIDNNTVVIFQWIVYTFVNQTVVVFGIGTNIISIMCFVKQGFKEPINISLFGLAISDLGCLTTMLWANIILTPAFSDIDLPFHVVDVAYMVSALPHSVFTRITSWITAIITLERCLCIITPLKVKTIVTPHRVALLISCVFIIFIISGSPVYVVNKLGIKFFPRRNMSLVGIVSTVDREKVEMIYHAINSFFLPFAAFIVITVCTTILVVKLKESTKWRKTSTTAGHADGSIRNQRVTKMVLMISTLFIICFVPITIVMLALAFEPGLSDEKKYLSIGMMVSSIGILLESVNSSANIFIYYTSSTKYREAFRSIFWKRIDKKTFKI